MVNKGVFLSAEQEGGDPDCDFPEDPEFIALDDLPEAKPSTINMVHMHICIYVHIYIYMYEYTYIHL